MPTYEEIAKIYKCVHIHVYLTSKVNYEAITLICQTTYEAISPDCAITPKIEHATGSSIRISELRIAARAINIDVNVAFYLWYSTDAMPWQVQKYNINYVKRQYNKNKIKPIPRY